MATCAGMPKRYPEAPDLPRVPEGFIQLVCASRLHATYSQSLTGIYLENHQIEKKTNSWKHMVYNEAYVKGLNRRQIVYFETCRRIYGIQTIMEEGACNLMCII